MTAAHVHLILTHVPIVGVAVAALLFVVAWAKGSAPFQRVALSFIVLFALLTIPLYFTGEAAEEVVERMPGVSEPVLEEHEEAGGVSFAAVELLGAVALLGLLAFRRRPGIPAAFSAVIVVLSLVSTGLLVYTGSLGGQIRRPELRAEGAATDVGHAQPARDGENDD